MPRIIKLMFQIETPNYGILFRETFPAKKNDEF